MSQVVQEKVAVHGMGNTAVVLPKVKAIGGVKVETDVRQLVRFGIGPGESLYVFMVDLGEGRGVSFTDKNLDTVEAERKALLAALEAWYAPTILSVEPLAGEYTEEPDLEEFIAEFCSVGPQESARPADLFALYRDQVYSRLLPEYGFKYFCKALRERGYDTHVVDGITLFKGIGLAEQG